jgi:glycine/D-amino acid oxidase-like deaminating enzyme
MTHTPGPYHISHDEDGGTTIRDDDGLIIAGVYGFAAPDREGQEEANSTLLAAAPELLAALKAALPILRQAHDRGFAIKEVEPVYNQAEAAIKQAEAK